jgi:hypothetical protein
MPPAAANPPSIQAVACSGSVRSTGATECITDLLGAVLTVLRSRSDKAARGQFYTPADACDLLAPIVGTPGPGESVCEPAAGTGGMLRAVAKALRDQGRTLPWCSGSRSTPTRWRSPALR